MAGSNPLSPKLFANTAAPEERGEPEGEGNREGEGRSDSTEAEVIGRSDTDHNPVPEEEEAPEEARPAKPARSPILPTAAQREEHEATHLPFRSWCRFCVSGRRDSQPHSRIPQEHGAQEVSLDYCFIRRREEEQTMTILLLKDRATRAIRAWALQRKGVQLEEPAELAAGGIADLGYRGRVWVKCDNEPALRALRQAVMAKLEGASPIDPPEHESPASGIVESGVKTWKGVLRVHLLALEHKIGGGLPSDHPVMTWLIQFVADTINKGLVGADGMTPYERLHHGKKWRAEEYEFGEQVMWRHPRAGEEHAIIDGRFSPGVWLGRQWGGIVHHIGLSDGSVVSARSIERLPKEERWSRAALERITQATYGAQRHDSERPVIVIPPKEEETPAPEPVAAERPWTPKSASIYPADLQQHGYTQGCRKCTLVRAGKHKEAKGKRKQGVLWQ